MYLLASVTSASPIATVLLYGLHGKIERLLELTLVEANELVFRLGQSASALAFGHDGHWAGVALLRGTTGTMNVWLLTELDDRSLREPQALEDAPPFWTRERLLEIGAIRPEGAN